MSDTGAGYGEKRCEPLHPPVDGNVVDLDAALDQQPLHIAVGQAIAQVPPHRDHDHLGRETRSRRRQSRMAARNEDGRTASPVKPASIDRSTDATDPGGVLHEYQHAA